MISELYALLKKELLVEMRNAGGVLLALASAAVSVIAVSFASSITGIPKNVEMLLFWIVIFFSCMQSLPHSFLRERLEHTYLFLRVVARPSAVLFSKLIFNIVLCIFIACIVTLLFAFFVSPDVFLSARFFLLAVTGASALACSATLVSAIAAASESTPALFIILAFPVILPVLWMCVRASNELVQSGAAASGNILFLLAFSLSMTAVSYLLFKFIWAEE